ncbi:hypothetical protein M0804_009060 [Polistes exclamans]|nr:hypothetical protein M0804_009060 [Polistes exclamans]
MGIVIVITELNSIRKRSKVKNITKDMKYLVKKKKKKKGLKGCTTYLNGGDQKPQLVVSKDRKAVARRSCWLPRGKFSPGGMAPTSSP